MPRNDGLQLSGPYRVKRAKGDRWEIRYRIPGASVQRSETCPDEAEARERMLELGRLYSSGTIASDQWRRETSVEELIDLWWPTARDKLSAATRDTYGRAISNHIVPFIGASRVGDLVASPRLVRQWHTQLRAAGRGVPTVLKSNTVLSAAMRYAMEDLEHIDSNPCTGLRIERVRETKRHDRAFTAEQVVAMMQELGAEYPEHHRAVKRRPLRSSRPRPWLARLRSQVFYSVMVGAGLRPSELLALTRDRVRDTGLWIDRAAKADGTAGPTKTGKSRMAALPSFARSDLEVWLAMSDETGYDGDWVFPKRGGGMWTPSAYESWRKDVWVPAAERMAARKDAWARLADADPYSGGRHSSLSLSVLGGATDLGSLSARSGNSVEVLSAHYLHDLSEGRDRRELKTLDQLITEARVAADFTLVGPKE